MSFTKEIFKRATIKGLTEYLLYGISQEEDNMNYEKRLNEAYLKYEKIALRYDQVENSELFESANELTSETASVYTEIGLQTGFLIMLDMMKNIGAYSILENSMKEQVSDNK